MKALGIAGFAVLAASAGWVAGRTVHVSDRAAEPVRSSSVIAAPVDRPSSAAAAVDWQHMRVIVREEVRSALVREPTSTESSESKAGRHEDVLPQNDPRHQLAVDTLNALVAAGQWQNDDRRTFREHMAYLTDDEREGFIRRLVLGMNKGTIQVPPDGPPF